MPLQIVCWPRRSLRKHVWKLWCALALRVRAPRRSVPSVTIRFLLITHTHPLIVAQSFLQLSVPDRRPRGARGVAGLRPGARSSMLCLLRSGTVEWSDLAASWCVVVPARKWATMEGGAAPVFEAGIHLSSPGHTRSTHIFGAARVQLHTYVGTDHVFFCFPHDHGSRVWCMYCTSYLALSSIKHLPNFLPHRGPFRLPA